MPNNPLTIFVCCTSCLFVHASIKKGACSSVSTSFVVLHPVLVQNLLLYLLSKLLPTFIHLSLTLGSPPWHFFRVFLPVITRYILHLISRPSFNFFFSSKPFAFLHWDIRSCTTKSSTLCMTSASKEPPSLSSNFSSSFHYLSIWSPFCQSSSSSSSSFSICEQSQFCLTFCTTVLCAVGLASSCALAFFSMPAATS